MSDDAFFSFIIRDTLLSSLLVEAVMDGLYSMLMLYTLQSAFNRPQFISKNRWLLSTLLVLYILTVSHLAVQWTITRSAFVTHGDTSDDIVNELLDGPIRLSLVSASTSAATTVLADCILVWRCWVIWGRNWKAAAVPALTTIAELVMAIFGIIRQSQPVTSENVTADPQTMYLGLSLGTTVLTTILIVYRILSLGSASKHSPYLTVIEIIVESAALYSLSLVLFLPFYVQTDLTLNCASEYLKRIVVGMTGIAPTLIVARAAAGLARPNDSWSGVMARWKDITVDDSQLRSTRDDQFASLTTVGSRSYKV